MSASEVWHARAPGPACASPGGRVTISADPEDLAGVGQVGVGLQGLGAEVGRELLAVLADHPGELRQLGVGQLLVAGDLLGAGGAEVGVRGHPAAAVLPLGVVGGQLVLGLARGQDEAGLLDEVGLALQLGDDLGLGQEGVVVGIGHCLNLREAIRREPRDLRRAHPGGRRAARRVAPKTRYAGPARISEMTRCVSVPRETPGNGTRWYVLDSMGDSIWHIV